jgi:hypothetical protein
LSGSPRLRGGWSPASIAGRLAIDYPDNQACRVSHEAIYQWVYAHSGFRNQRPTRKTYNWKKLSELFTELVEAESAAGYPAAALQLCIWILGSAAGLSPKVRKPSGASNQ